MKALNILVKAYKSSLFMRKALIILVGFGLLPNKPEDPQSQIAIFTLFLIFCGFVLLVDLDYKQQNMKTEKETDV